MPSKRELLEHLNRDELVALVDRFGLEVADRRAKAGLVDALGGSKKIAPADVLADLSRERLKELCRARGLDDGGREKATIIARLTGGGAGRRRRHGARASPRLRPSR